MLLEDMSSGVHNNGKCAINEGGWEQNHSDHSVGRLALAVYQTSPAHISSDKTEHRFVLSQITFLHTPALFDRKRITLISRGAL